ncbi:MAG: hypothetical protein FJ319_00825 [SAR202 cluster bacterium]|nr:hypothetical protein [SAR202 cluster bacterium]
MPMKKLTDSQMRDFVRNGFVRVQTALPPEFHREIFRASEELNKEGNPGNNLLAKVPAMQKIYDDPGVAGALASILGDDYFMQPHRHMHFNPPGSPGQTMHKDSFTRRRHHTRWMVTFYFPQDTTVEMGPTGVVPGSHYFNKYNPETDTPESFMAGPAGSVVIANYDVWHRATPNRSQKNRYMHKYLFTRMSEPTAPSWRSTGDAWVAKKGDQHTAMWSHMWDWHYGKLSKGRAGTLEMSEKEIRQKVAALSNDSERVAFDAAYTLAKVGEKAARPLVKLLSDGSAEKWYTELTRRPPGQTSPSANASYALMAMGAPAVPLLVDLASSRNMWNRASAVVTLMDIGPAAKASVPAIAAALKDDSPLVRQFAAEAMGTVSQGTSKGVAALVPALKDQDETVRRFAALSLAKIGPHAKGATKALISSLGDSNRYVVGNALHALHRIDTAESREAVLAHLFTARWDRLTTKTSLY